MTVKVWIDHASKNLEKSSSSARLDTLILTEHFLKVDRTILLANGNKNIPESKMTILKKALERRLRGEPLAYIIGYIEFYGRKYYVDRHVLTPRPESESFIRIVSKIVKSNPKFRALLDIGTGSGVLAISIKLVFPNLIVSASDISPTALRVAARNALTYHASILLEKCNLLRADNNAYHIIVANLPYVPVRMANPSIKFEPKRALFSGNDGLNHYRRLFIQLKLRPVPFIVIEALESQFNKLDAIAKKSSYRVVYTEGLVRAYRHTSISI